MSRFSSAGSYGHHCTYHKYHDYYAISWVVDRYYVGSRLRFPRTTRRSTDEAGARRFCKKWDIPFPEVDKKGE